MRDADAAADRAAGRCRAHDHLGEPDRQPGGEALGAGGRCRGRGSAGPCGGAGGRASDE